MEIHKSVSVIVPPGIHAGLSPITGIPLPGYPGQFGVVLIDIQNTDVVVLRGLNINHQGTVTGGIEWISPNRGTVYIENVVVNGFPKEGLYVQINPAGIAVGANLHIKDSVFRNNGTGIYATLTAHILADRIRVENSSIGVRMLGSPSDYIHAAFADSSIAGNQVSLQVDSTAGGGAVFVELGRCSIVDNIAAFQLDSGLSGYVQLEMAGNIFMANGPNNVTGNVSLGSHGNNSGAGISINSPPIPPF